MIFPWKLPEMNESLGISLWHQDFKKQSQQVLSKETGSMDFSIQARGFKITDSHIRLSHVEMDHGGMYSLYQHPKEGDNEPNHLNVRHAYGKY